MVGDFKKANPGFEAPDITIEDIRQYLDERAKNPKIHKRVRRIIEDYENIKNSM